MKYQTVIFDTAGEMARLYFSFAIKKHASEMEKLRELPHYNPTTERLNIFFRRVRELKKAGSNVVFFAHEQIDKIYAKGGAVTPKGQQPQEPIAVRGMPDLPGSVAPEELMRKCDNVLRMRTVNGQLTWIAREENMGNLADTPWTAGCRFNALAIQNGYLPASYAEIVNLASKFPAANFNPPYTWMIYGRSKIGKTRTVLTFPKPIKLFDLDDGSAVLGTPTQLKEQGIDVVFFNTEEMDEYSRFLAEVATCFE